MQSPSLQTDTEIQADEVVLTVNQTTLNGQSPFNMPEFIHPHEVEQKVNEFNDASNDLILEYHYARIDPRTLTIQALFKPLFTKLGESQKYAYFRVFRENDHAFQCEHVAGSPPDLKVPAGVDPVPVRSICVTRVDGGESAPRIEVRVRLLHDASTYKNINVFVGFVKKLLQSLYDHAKDVK